MAQSPAMPTTRSYCEFRLGQQSKATLLKNLISSIGYQYSGEDAIPGLSGLRHKFDAIGTRGKNILLVVGGAEMADIKDKEKGHLNPRAQMERWRDQALLSAYDVQAALQMEGLIVDLMFFHNINNMNHLQAWAGSKDNFKKWMNENHIPPDITALYSLSANNIPIMLNDELAIVAQSIGACFLSLDDLKLDEIALLANVSEGAVSEEKIKEVLLKRRVLQYFSPPTDELILSAYDLTKRHDKGLLGTLYHSAGELGHPTAQNVLVPGANYKDPIETAKALEKHKYISFEHKLEITESGFSVSQSIRKTAQGSIVIRILKSIGLGDLAKSIVQTIKGI